MRSYFLCPSLALFFDAVLLTRDAFAELTATFFSRDGVLCKNTSN
jgi:hypothetical protein